MITGKKLRIHQLEIGSISLYIAAFLLIAIPYGIRLWLLQTRHFDQDEFQHLHGAWLISKGLLPYRDYFEHHTPWFHFFLAPFYSFFRVETSVEDAFAFLFFARRLMWLLTGVIVLLTFWLGKVWRDHRVGAISVLFMVNTDIFLTTTLEIRPDLLAATFWLACLITLIYAVRSERTIGSKAHWKFAWSGAFLGAGIMATQKLLFAFPGLAVAMCLYIFTPITHGTRQFRLRNFGYQLAGFALPILVTGFYFYSQNSLAEFVDYNFLFNLRFKERFAPYGDLHKLIYSSPYLASFGILGLIQVLLSFFKRESLWPGNAILLVNTLSVIAGLFLIPVPNLQYYLLFLPLFSLFAGAFFIDVADKAAELANHMAWRKWVSLVVSCSIPVLAFLALTCFGVGSPHPILVTLYWFTIFAASALLLRSRAHDIVLVLFLVALSIPSFKRMGDHFDSRNTAQLDALRYVIERTVPTDTVMDGFTGAGVFRPHAYFYFFPHQGIRLMLSAADHHYLLVSLESQRINPTLILFDKYLANLSPAITAFLKQHYQPVGTGDIWRRKENT